MEFELRQVLTQAIAFLIMLWILKRYAWGPLYAIIDERKKRIESEFDLIESQKVEAEKLNEFYRQKIREIESEAKAKIKEAIEQSRKIAEESIQDTKNQSKAMLNKAREEIESELIQAKEQLKNDIVDMAISISKKVIGKTLDKDQEKKLIDNMLEEAKLR